MNSTLQELKETISTHLDLCNYNDTPFVCSNCSTPDGKAKIIDTIAEMIIKQDISIGGAIVALERLYNPNMID